jgi:hypothetical protein
MSDKAVNGNMSKGRTDHQFGGLGASKVKGNSLVYMKVFHPFKRGLGVLRFEKQE